MNLKYILGFLFSCLFFIELYGEGPYHNDDYVIPDTEIEKESELNWKDYDIPDTFPELQILDQLDPKKSEKYLKSAKKNYDIALKIIKESKKEAQTVPDKYKHLPETHYWQIQEKEEKIKKKQNEIMTEAYQKAKIYVIKGLQDLEKIKAHKILQTEYYINLKSNLLRHYVLLQLSLKDVSGIIHTIEEYFSLKDSHKEEAQPYKILAYCYQYLEKISEKSHASEEIVLQYRKLKYKNLLQFVILKYGKNSPQYNYLKKEIERQMINDIL
ncbi:MAG: hypothetical protein KatS3mg129_2866 [Leptospiraceae bacterium]|nr:MAG: hypothetical protein KatS3mg129_2866 [Leptospiraceae bacterium]